MKRLKILECIHEMMGKLWVFELVDMRTKEIIYKDSIADEEEKLDYEEVNQAVQNILKIKGFLN